MPASPSFVAAGGGGEACFSSFSSFSSTLATSVGTRLLVDTLVGSGRGTIRPADICAANVLTGQVTGEFAGIAWVVGNSRWASAEEAEPWVLVLVCLVWEGQVVRNRGNTALYCTYR